MHVQRCREYELAFMSLNPLGMSRFKPLAQLGMSRFLPLAPDVTVAAVDAKQILGGIHMSLLDPIYFQDFPQALPSAIFNEFWIEVDTLLVIFASFF